MKKFEKILNPGRGACGEVYISVSFDGVALSLHGVEGPTKNGNCQGGCGQINDFEITHFSPGWTEEKVEELRAVWNRWHLNDLRAGTPIQEEWIRKNGHGKDYSDTCTLLKKAGILTVDGYTYGTSWLREEVPEEVLNWLLSLPDSERTPAWI